MKREPSKQDKKILRFLLEQQLPEAKVAALGPDGKSISSSFTSLDDSVAVTAVDHVTQVALETCRCVHLQEHLPDILDLELCRATHHPRGWVVANPVHSMHLDTQLEDSIPVLAQNKHPPVLYGEEQQRTLALSTEGIVEHWCPLDGYSAVIHDDTAREKMEHMPTLHNIKSDKSQSPTMPAATTPSFERKPSPHQKPSIQPENEAKKSETSISANASSDIIPSTTESLPQAIKSLPSPTTKEPTSPDPNPAADTVMKEASPVKPQATHQEVSSASAPILNDPPSVSIVPESKRGANLPVDATTPHQKVEEKAKPDRQMETTPTDVVDMIVEDTPPKTTESSSPSNKDEGTARNEPAMAESKESPSLEDLEENGATSARSDALKPSEVPASAESQPKERNQAAEGEDRPDDDTKSDIKSNEAMKQNARSEGGSTVVSAAVGPESQNASKSSDVPSSSDKLTADEEAKDSNGKGTDGIGKEEPADVGEKQGGPTTPSNGTEVKPDNNGSANYNKNCDVDAANNDDAGKISDASLTSKPTAVSSAAQPSIVKAEIVPSTSSGPAGAKLTDVSTMEEEPIDSEQEKEDERLDHLRLEEDRIRLIRRSLSSHRIITKKKTDVKKKRKREDLYKTPGIPGWRASAPKELTEEQENQWLQAQAASHEKVEKWMVNYRACREKYWKDKEGEKIPPENRDGKFYMSNESDENKQCIDCDGHGRGSGKPRRQFRGDDLMQCLECNFVGCSPKSLTPDSRQQILEHLLLSGHKFAMSCGERGQLFCFCCGDFVYHEVFEREKERIDCSMRLPMFAWKKHQMYRSFDPLQFIKTQDHGIVWKGLIATFPQLIPQEHLRATNAVVRREALFRGHIDAKSLAHRPHPLALAVSQNLLGSDAKCKIAAPVGMYNLGNTCFKSSVLQCLTHCPPLQRFFLAENGHHHHACTIYRKKEAAKKKRKKNARGELVCLACDMDRLFLSYYGSTIGNDVRGAVEEVCGSDNEDYEVNETIKQGEPLVISEMLTASWTSGGMNSLTGYKQHDAHEFLNSFLELMGEQTKQYWDRIFSSINSVKAKSSIVPERAEEYLDISKRIFEGSLSSVLLCSECGTKRKRREEFLNVSLSLSEEVERLQATNNMASVQLSLETCLEHFVSPENLGDPVNCPACSRKTPTKKQHTFATLPKVLCFHLKRFDAAKNKKIEDFVSFPSQGLNMGKFLAQWCEVTSVPSDTGGTSTEPLVNYELFGTVNHVGNMQSGHYVANVKVKDKWYDCNDAYVGLAGGTGDEETVLANAGAYILFYIRTD